MAKRELCECKGSIRTVVIEDENWYKCPRCGGGIKRPAEIKAQESTDNTSCRNAYWVNPTPSAAHLMYGEDPFATLVAVVCNIKWAKKLCDMLNENDPKGAGVNNGRKTVQV